MINPIFWQLGGKLIMYVIDKIFDNEKEHPSRGSGNTKRDQVYKAVLKMTIDNELSFDDLGDYISDQVDILNKFNISWSLGSEIINMVIKNMFDEQITRNPGGIKRENVIVSVIKHASQHKPLGEVKIDDMRGFICNQVDLFKKYKVFLKKAE